MKSIVLLLCAMALGAAEPVSIVCLGDSITGDRPGKPYIHLYSKWTDLLQLCIETRTGVGSARVINAGWGGDTTHGKPSGDPPGAVKRLQSDVLDQKPAIAVVLIGGNNFAVLKTKPEERGAVEERYRADLTDLVTRMRTASIRVLLLQYHEPFAADMSAVWTTLDDANPIIAAVAEATQVPTLELAPAFRAARESGVPPEALTNTKDGVHLAPYGEIVVARTVFAKLVELGWLAGNTP